MKYRLCALFTGLSLLMSTGCIVDAVSIEDTEVIDASDHRRPEFMGHIATEESPPTHHLDAISEMGHMITRNARVFTGCLDCPMQLPKPVQLGDPDCDLSPRWAHDGGDLYNGIQSAKLSRSGHMVYGASFDSDLLRTHPLDGAFAIAYRTVDGQPLFQIETDALPRMMNSTGGLSVSLERQCQGECRGNEPMDLVARNMMIAEVWRMDLEDDLYRPQLLISQNGHAAVLSDCIRTSARTRDTRLRTIDVDTGAIVSEMTVPGDCLYNPFFGFESRVLSEDGRYLVLTQSYRHEMRLFDLKDQVEMQLPSGPLSRVFNLAFNHDETRLLAVITRPDEHGQAKAELHQWRFPELTDMPSRDDISILGLNRLSYMPVDVSPLTFSHDGRLFAHLNTQGQVVIERADSGERLHTLETLNFDATGAEHWGNAGNEPVGVRLDPSGEGVLVSYTGGLAYFSCADSVAQQAQRLMSVHLTGPLQTAVGVPTTYRARTEHARDIQGFGFSVDGESLGFPTTTPTLTLTFDEPGSYRVELDVFDGVSVGHVSRLVTVIP